MKFSQALMLVEPDPSQDDLDSHVWLLSLLGSALAAFRREPLDGQPRCFM